jgi:hypothetical protein
MGKIPKSEPAPETRDTPSVIYAGSGFTDLRDGQDYRIVVIGEQTRTVTFITTVTDTRYVASKTPHPVKELYHENQ